MKIIETGKNGGDKVINTNKFQIKYEKYKEAIMNKPDEEDEDLNMEEDLKKVLVEVMCLSTEMKKQVKILEQKGISHD